MTRGQARDYITNTVNAQIKLAGKNGYIGGVYLADVKTVTKKECDEMVKFLFKLFMTRNKRR